MSITKYLVLCGVVPVMVATAGTGVLPRASAMAAANSTPAVIERLDPALNEIIPPDAKLELLSSGFGWTEGPIWTRDGYLLFADIYSNTIHKLGADGKVTVFMQPSGYTGTEPYGGPEPGSNGMTLDHKGRLTVAGHAARNIWRLESLDPNGPKTILADTYEGKRLNSPNDLVYRSDGSLYFTDPPYGLRTQDEKDPAIELSVNGVYRIPGAESQKAEAAPNRSALQLLIKDLPRPNGIAFSPDEKFLYVDNTEPRKFWMRYPVNKDGSLGPGEVFFDATGDRRLGSPDGMKVDQKGNIYSTGPGGIWIFSPAGKHLGTIDLPGSTANMNWGDADGKTLYITESDNVLRIRLNIPGVRP
jgi:gluconolactonase